MAIERIKITDARQWHRLRRADVTASVVGSLFGAHDFVTPFSLYLAKTGRAPDVEETPAMQRGRLWSPSPSSLLREHAAERGRSFTMPLTGTTSATRRRASAQRRT